MEARKLAKSAVSRSERTEKFRWDYTLGCIGFALAIIIALAPPQTPLSAGAWLLALFIVFVYPMLHLVESLCRSTNERITYPVAIAVLVCGIFVFGRHTWPHERRHIFTDAERQAFEKPLKAQTTPREEIQIACPQADESVCVYAAQFINMFREAGWRIQDNQVQRGMLGTPLAGVVLFSHSDSKPDPNNWRSGVWTAFTPSVENVYQGFANVGVEPDSSSRTDIPENVMTVYFGSEKSDEGEKTQLTAAIETIRRYRKEVKLPKPTGRSEEKGGA